MDILSSLLLKKFIDSVALHGVKINYPIFRVDNGILQYKYPDDTVWQNLYAFPSGGNSVDIEGISNQEIQNMLNNL